MSSFSHAHNTPRLDSLKEYPRLELKHRVADCSLRTFDSESPIFHLYQAASRVQSTLEGTAALQGVMNLNAWYREKGIPRVDDVKSLRKVPSCVLFAQK